MNSPDTPEAHEPGIIGETEEGGFPVVFKFVDELPSPDVRETLPWLTVIAWNYDGRSRNGMPSALVMSQMVALPWLDGATEYYLVTTILKLR
jgi:hypothetical protein